MNETIIRTVYRVSSSGQLLITIPANKGIDAGDNVMITRIPKRWCEDAEEKAKSANNTGRT